MLTAPFPYYGDKRRVAQEVWHCIGAVDRYIETFFGSGAVLLANPHPESQKQFGSTRLKPLDRRTQ